MVYCIKPPLALSGVMMYHIHIGCLYVPGYQIVGQTLWVLLFAWLVMCRIGRSKQSLHAHCY